MEALFNSSDGIRMFQDALIKMGLMRPPADGIYGPATKYAVSEFRKKFDLPQSEEMDQETFEFIMRNSGNVEQTVFSSNIDVEENADLSKKSKKSQRKGKTSARQEMPGLEDENPPEHFNRAAISMLDSDTPSAELEDKLDFRSDIQALASIMAYKEIKPPLAIGLFGNWGSGKSFFMSKLKQRIEELANRKSDTYCQKIIQINFNSWHYSDSNLWASLITKIFEDLSRHGKEDPVRLNKLLENLNSTQELLEETRKKQEHVDLEISSMNQRLNIVEQEIRNEAARLHGLTLKDIGLAILEDDAVSADLDAIREKYSFLDLTEFKSIRSNLLTLDSTAKRLWKSLKLVWSFRVGNRWVIIGLALLVFLASYILVENVAVFTTWFGKMKLLVVPVSMFISQTVAFLAPATKWVNSAHDKLVSLKKTCDKVEASVINQQNRQRDEIRMKIQASEQAHAELRLHYEQLISKRNQLQNEIDDITSGRKIIRFIESRVSDQRYINSLGIISWVRKDFEELDFLLKQQYDPERLEQLQRQKIENVFEIDRIILYIDDLDRCDVTIVVKVLEAIHLLLAFPLFVVVVGVDPRWMHNALRLKYEKFLDENPEVITETEEKMLEEGEISGRPATSYDYLEKIFQIPFVLKPMDDTGKRNLIRSQLEEKPKKSDKSHETGKGMPGQAGKGKPASDQGSGDAKSQGTPNDSQEELLKIGPEEISFMQSIGFLLGDSPRTVKRYINIYRIIRAHSKFRFIDQNENEHYFATMIMLGFITGTPESSKAIFQKMKDEEDSKLFVNFIGDFLAMDLREHPIVQNLHEKMGEEKNLEFIGQIPLRKFKANIDLISRFSFRNLA